MDISFVYLLRRLLYRFLDFFHHWYVDGSRAFARKFISTLRSADETFAVAITFRHFFEPLYKDYSGVGRVVGFVFRFLRIIIGVIFYLLITIIFAAVYFIWVAIPAVIIYYAARNL